MQACPEVQSRSTSTVPEKGNSTVNVQPALVGITLLDAATSVFGPLHEGVLDAQKAMHSAMGGS